LSRVSERRAERPFSSQASPAAVVDLSDPGGIRCDYDRAGNEVVAAVSGAFNELEILHAYCNAIDEWAPEVLNSLSAGLRASRVTTVDAVNELRARYHLEAIARCPRYNTFHLFTDYVLFLACEHARQTGERINLSDTVTASLTSDRVPERPLPSSIPEPRYRPIPPPWGTTTVRNLDSDTLDVFITKAWRANVRDQTRSAIRNAILAEISAGLDRELDRVYEQAETLGAIADLPRELGRIMRRLVLRYVRHRRPADILTIERDNGLHEDGRVATERRVRDDVMNGRDLLGLPASSDPGGRPRRKQAHVVSRVSRRVMRRPLTQRQPM
jgi:hypothetical protein